MYFLILSEKNPGFRQTFSPRMSKLKKSTWQVKFPGKKTFLGKKIDLLYLLMFFFEQNLACKETPCLPGRHSTSPIDHSEGQFFGRNKIFQTFEIWTQTFCVPGETTMSDLPKVPSMCPGKHFRNFFGENHSFDFIFWFWVKKAPFFDTSSRQACQKPESMWPGKVFEKSLLGKTYIFVSFYGLSKEKSFCKETLRLPRRHSTSPVDHSEGQISRRNKILQTFEIWARIFWVFGETKLAELLKLPSMCPGKNFKKKDFSGKKHSFDSNFWFWGKKVPMFGNSFCKGCQNRTARDRENFVKKFFLEVKTIFFLVFWRNFDSP